MAFSAKKLQAFINGRGWSYTRLASELTTVLERQSLPVSATAVYHWLHRGAQPRPDIRQGLAILSCEDKEAWDDQNIA